MRDERILSEGWNEETLSDKQSDKKDWAYHKQQRTIHHGYRHEHSEAADHEEARHGKAVVYGHVYACLRLQHLTPL